MLKTPESKFNYLINYKKNQLELIRKIDIKDNSTTPKSLTALMASSPCIGRLERSVKRKKPAIMKIDRTMVVP